MTRAAGSASPGPGIPARELTEVLLSAARTPCVVIVDETAESHLRWANNGVTTDGVATAQSVSVVVIDGDRYGVASGSGLDAGGALELLAQAQRSAGTAASSGGAPADAARPASLALPLPGPPEAAQDPQLPAGDLLEPLDEFVAELGDVLRQARSQDVLTFGFAHRQVHRRSLATSTGVWCSRVLPQEAVQLTAKRAGDSSASVWQGAVGTAAAAGALRSGYEGCRERLGWYGRRVELAPGRYPVLLTPSAVADLMISLYWSASLREALDGRSAFAAVEGRTRIGEQVADRRITLRSDPADAAVPAFPLLATAASGDRADVHDNGAPLRAVRWIEQGRLDALVATRSGAAAAAAPPALTVENLLLDSGADGSVAEMVGRCDRALLVTCLWYLRDVDPRSMLLTGLTRDGVFLVEHGRVTAAVNNFRFNESPLGLLGRVEAVGRSEPALAREFGEYFPRTVMPPLLVRDFEMSSVSPAS